MYPTATAAPTDSLDPLPRRSSLKCVRNFITDIRLPTPYLIISATQNCILCVPIFDNDG